MNGVLINIYRMMNGWEKIQNIEGTFTTVFSSLGHDVTLLKRLVLLLIGVQHTSHLPLALADVIQGVVCQPSKPLQPHTLSFIFSRYSGGKRDIKMSI